VETIQGRALRVSRGADGAMLKTEQSFKAIPYFAWANRGKGEMQVWFLDSADGGKSN
jgi:DUF1680 family protein